MSLGLELYAKAFWDLISDRLGGNRIPWTAIHAWCASKGITGEDEDDVHFLVGRMDMAYVDWARKKSKPTEQRPNAKHGGVRTKR